jgi:enoyl-CoA hydratase
MSPLITVEKKLPVLVAVMNAPKANALTEELVAELRAVVASVEDDPAVGCLALMSARRNFCSGADLELIKAAKPDPLEPSIYAMFGKIYDLFTTILNASVPTIAGVAGHVVGAGINLALACDLRIAADDLLVSGFAAAQVHPGGGHMRMLTRQMRSDWAAALTLFGQSLDARAAVESGFALRSVVRDKLSDEVLNTAAGIGGDVELVRNVTASYRATQSSVLTPQAALMLERAAQVWSLHRRP